MDIGVTLLYILWSSQYKEGQDKVFLSVVKNIYGDLSRESLLFHYLSQQGVKAEDIIGALRR